MVTIDSIGNLDLGKYIPFMGGGTLWTTIFGWVIIYGIGFAIIIWMIKRGANSVRVEIYMKTGSGYRIKTDRGKFVKIGEIEALKLRREREHIPLPPQTCVFLTNRFLGRGEKLMLLKDSEGGLHYMSIPEEKHGYDAEYISIETGKKKKTWVPYIVPENRNLKEWYKNITRVFHERLHEKKWYEAMAPYATFSLVCIMCIMVIYMTFNKIGGG